MLAIMCESFGLPFQAAREIFYGDPYFDLANKQVLRQDGAVVSVLTIVDTTCWLGGSLIRMAGIAGVATRPDVRKMGYAAELLTQTLALLRGRGFPLVGLVPFSHDYYRRLGFETASIACRYMTSPSTLPAYPETRAVRLARPDDVPDLVRIYLEMARGQALHCERDEKRWHYILDHVKQRVVWAAGGRVEGYVLYDHRPGPGHAEGGPEVAPTLRILEMVASTQAARRGLIGHLASQATVGSIEYVSTARHLERVGLLSFDHGPTPGNTAFAGIEVVPAVMARLLDIGHLAQSLTENWLDFTGAVCLVVRDPLLPDGTGTALISGHGEGSPHVTSGIAPGRCEHRVEGDVRAWTQVAVGKLGADDACDLGLLTPSTPQARAQAALLFPRRVPFLPTPDHF
jgi:predicted acetyltransferase